jgi:hypothetical protein
MNFQSHPQRSILRGPWSPNINAANFRSASHLAQSVGPGALVALVRDQETPPLCCNCHILERRPLLVI